MAHLIPYDALRKSAAHQSADELGRQLARVRVSEAMAKEAGQLLAHELLKEAGLFTSLGRAAKGAAGKVRSGVKGLFKKPPGKLSPKLTSKVTPKAPRPASAAPKGGGQRISPLEGVKAPSTPGGPYRTPGKVQARQPAGDWSKPGAAPSKPPSGAAGTQAAKRATETGVSSAAPAAAEAATKAPVGGGVARTLWRWRAPLALAGVAGLGYGALKGAGWASRQLEQASTVPMAYGGGWSPVAYGYGHTPYGEGMAGMGPGG